MEYDESTPEPVPAPFTEAEVAILTRMTEYLEADANRREALRLEWRARRAMPETATERRKATRDADLARLREQ
jgi:hypothetical protein